MSWFELNWIEFQTIWYQVRWLRAGPVADGFSAEGAGQSLPPAMFHLCPVPPPALHRRRALPPRRRPIPLQGRLPPRQSSTRYVPSFAYQNYTKIIWLTMVSSKLTPLWLTSMTTIKRLAIAALTPIIKTLLPNELFGLFPNVPVPCSQIAALRSKFSQSDNFTVILESLSSNATPTILSDKL